MRNPAAHLRINASRSGPGGGASPATRRRICPIPNPTCHSSMCVSAPPSSPPSNAWASLGETDDGRDAMISAIEPPLTSQTTASRHNGARSSVTSAIVINGGRAYRPMAGALLSGGTSTTHPSAINPRISAATPTSRGGRRVAQLHSAARHAIPPGIETIMPATNAGQKPMTSPPLKLAIASVVSSSAASARSVAPTGEQVERFAGEECNRIVACRLVIGDVRMRRVKGVNFVVSQAAFVLTK